VVVGLVVYVVLSRSGPLGFLGWLFSFKAMVLAQAILVLPVAMALTRRVVEDAEWAHGEQLESLGARAMLRGALLGWDERYALLTVVIACFGRAISEVGAVMIVGGNIEGFTRVMTTAIALETSKGDLPLAIALGIVLLLVVLALNALMGLPPVVVGLVVYLLLSRAGPLGSLGLLFTPGAMVIAQTLLILPIIAALCRQAVEDAWLEYQEQLRSLGVEGVRAALTVLWDIRFSLLTALLAGLGRASAEVGAVMIVGGNIDGVTRVMTTTIALETSKGDLPLALALGMILILLVITLNAAAALIRDAAQRRYG
jgi:tungstate transport system permease protein